MSSSNPDYLEQAVSLASQEFVKGFVAGQVALLLLLFVIVKFFFLRGSSETKLERSRVFKKPKVKVFSPIRESGGEGSDIPSGWLHAVVNRLVDSFRMNSGFQDFLAGVIQKEMNSNNVNPLIDRISLVEVNFGERHPVLSNPVIESADVTGMGKLRAKFEFDWQDTLAVTVDTAVLINWPKQDMASLPVTLTVTVPRILGFLVLDFEPNGVFVWLEQGLTELGVQSLLGNRTKVKDLPKVSQIVAAKLKNIITAALARPRFIKFPHFSQTDGRSGTPRKAL